jgi:hypothetical protein
VAVEVWAGYPTVRLEVHASKGHLHGAAGSKGAHRAWGRIVVLVESVGEGLDEREVGLTSSRAGHGSFVAGQDIISAGAELNKRLAA